MSPLSGFERPFLVRAHITALERELRNPWSESHAEAVRAQLGIFTAELQRMEEEGIEDVPDPNDNPNPAHGTRTPDGAWVGR